MWEWTKAHEWGGGYPTGENHEEILFDGMSMENKTVYGVGLSESIKIRKRTIMVRTNAGIADYWGYSFILRFK